VRDIRLIMVIALYMRLSKQDGLLKEESSSICMQRALLQQYVREHFKAYQLEEFVDDGYSGTNWQRPGVHRLFEKVQMGAVDCIIVKDFSRFSRDYIELGAYLEQIFPLLGVRFIAVNDDYDSEQRTGEPAPLDILFKNILYDLYSKDISLKVKSAFAAKKENGQYLSANCPFGYEKAADDKHRLVVEKEEAEVVKRIFGWASAGYTSVQIAKMLNTERIKTPIQFKIQKGKMRRTPKGKSFEWSNSVICQILHNEMYMGDLVYGKYYRDEVGGKNHLRPKSEWKIYRNHHEPIISREMFAEVQKTRRAGKKISVAPRHPLVGKVVCQCGKNMRLRRGRNSYFACTCIYTTAQIGCIKKMNAMFLEQYVLFEMQQHTNAAKLSVEMVQTLIERIIVFEEDKIEIIWK